VIIDPAEHLGLARSAVSLFAQREGVPVDDSEAFADACVALVRCARGYDPSLGFQFSTYAMQSCRRAAISGFLTRTGWRRKGFVKVQARSVELTDELESRSMSDVDSAETVEAVRFAIAALNERHKYVVEQRMAGLRLQDIADVLGVSRERVRQLEEQAHAMLACKLSEFRSCGDGLS